MDLTHSIQALAIFNPKKSSEMPGVEPEAHGSVTILICSLLRQSLSLFQSENIDEERAVQEHEISLNKINVVKISPDGNKVAVGASDNVIYVADLDTDGDIKETIRLLGHTSGVTHVDWSADGLFLRSNSSDYELLFWRSEDGEHLTTDAELEALPSSWATRNWWVRLPSINYQVF